MLCLSLAPPPPPFKLRGVKECAARSNNVQNTAVAASIARPQGRPSLTFIFFPTLDDAGPHGNGTLQHSQRPRTQRPFTRSPESVFFFLFLSSSFGPDKVVQKLRLLASVSDKNCMHFAFCFFSLCNSACITIYAVNVG